jgi:glycosyltransferase involved in cell wall biosynthesis
MMVRGPSALAAEARSGHRSVQTPLLSILILTYNRERMLAECLKSVQSTASDCEIVVCDDASTDGTGDLLRAWVDHDPRIRYIRQPENVGMRANVETAAREARGKYIAFLADDDTVEPANYERKIAILEAYPQVGLVYSLAFATDQNLANREVYRRAEYLDYSYIGGRAEFSDLMSGNYIPGNSVVFRRSVLGEDRLIDPNLPGTLSDWDLWMRLAFASETAFINEPLVNVRFHSGTQSGLGASDMAMGMIAVWEKWLVHHPDPPVLENRTWERMRAVFQSEVQRLHGNDQPRAEACVAAFEEMRRAAGANASLVFAQRSRRIMPNPPQPRTVPLVWTGPVWSATGVGSDLRSMAAAADTLSDTVLRLEDVHLSLIRAEAPPNERRRRLSAHIWQSIPSAAKYVHVWQGPPDYLRVDEDASAAVVRVAVGDGVIPAALLEQASNVRAFWVPSRFDCRLLQEHGVPEHKLHVLPGSADVDDSAAEPIDLGTQRDFNFLSMVKLTDPGLDVLLQAFAREFRADEDVGLVLVLRSREGKTIQEVGEELRLWMLADLGNTAAQFPSINLWVSPLTDEGVASLLTASQAYVEPRPSRWGRAPLEAMACGTPVVGARVGPNADLLNEQNSFSNASELTVESLRHLMRGAFSAPDEVRRRGQRAREGVAATHSPVVVGQRLRELLDAL